MAPGARSEFGAPMFELPEVFRKKMYCIEESTCDICEAFWRPLHSFGDSAVIRRPGNCAPFVPPRYTPVKDIETFQPAAFMLTILKPQIHITVSSSSSGHVEEASHQLLYFWALNVVSILLHLNKHSEASATPKHL